MFLGWILCADPENVRHVACFSDNPQSSVSVSTDMTPKKRRTVLVSGSWVASAAVLAAMAVPAQADDEPGPDQTSQSSQTAPADGVDDGGDEAR